MKIVRRKPYEQHPSLTTVASKVRDFKDQLVNSIKLVIPSRIIDNHVKCLTIMTYTLFQFLFTRNLLEDN